MAERRDRAGMARREPTGRDAPGPTSLGAADTASTARIRAGRRRRRSPPYVDVYGRPAVRCSCCEPAAPAESGEEPAVYGSEGTDRSSTIVVILVTNVPIYPPGGGARSTERGAGAEPSRHSIPAEVDDVVAAERLVRTASMDGREVLSEDATTQPPHVRGRARHRARHLRGHASPTAEPTSTGNHPSMSKQSRPTPADPIAAEQARLPEPQVTPTSSTTLARRHLWMHFSRLGAFADARRPGHRAGRGLLRLGRRTASATSTGCPGCSPCRSVTAGAELAEAARAQAETLAYFPIWSYAHPPAIELAARLAELAPGDLNRVFFTTGGSEAVESAWKLARQYFRAIGQGQRHKVIARRDRVPRHDPGRARRSPASPRCARRSSRSRPGVVHVANTNRYRHPLADDEDAFIARGADAIEQRILFEGPETVAAVFLEPVQNAGGCFSPPPGYFQRVREICDHYGVLLVSDEVICAFGRLGHDVRLRALRLPARHDHVREGPHERLLAARRGDLSRLPRRAVPRGQARSRTASRSAAIR